MSVRANAWNAVMTAEPGEQELEIPASMIEGAVPPDLAGGPEQMQRTIALIIAGALISAGLIVGAIIISDSETSTCAGAILWRRRSPMCESGLT